MSYKAKFIIASLLAGFAANASASVKTPVVTLGGYIDTQVGFYSQKYPFNSMVQPATMLDNGDELLLTTPGFMHKIDKWGIVNDTKLRIAIDGVGHGFRYGGLIVLNTDTFNSKENEATVAHQTMAYVQSCLGRIEVGSYTGAYDAMKVNGASLARATGGIDGDWKYWINPDVDRPAMPATDGTGLTTLPFFPTLPTAFDKSYEANASKVNYYTPTYHGFRAGVTFIPDTDQHGTVTNLKTLTKSYTAFIFPGSPNVGNLGSANQTNSFTNVVQGGVSYKHKFNGVCFKLSALGEFGEAKKYVSAGGVIVDRHDLRAYEIGAKLNYRGFGVAGSYGDWGKTGFAKSVTGTVVTPVTGAKATNYWTIGANYVHHCYGVSFGYLSGESGGFGLSSNAGITTGLLGVAPNYSPLKGKARVYSFGADYRLAPGFMPYAEISQFSLNDRTDPTGGKNEGTVVLLGTKLTF